MEIRNLGIIAGIAVAVVGAITITSNVTEYSSDKLTVDYETVDVLLTNNERVFVVDVRSAEQYQIGHIVVPHMMFWLAKL